MSPEAADSTSPRILSKQDQADPRKKAWISLVLFARIGTFQWVTAIPNRKILILVSGCVQNISCGLFILFPARPRGGFDPAIGKTIARNSDSNKQMRRARNSHP
jgi:hypothetical protein